MALLSLPPGPGPISSDDHVALFRQGPLSFLHDLAQQYGDIVYFKRGTENVFLVNNPQYVNNVLVTHHRNFIKGRGLQRAKHLVGEGLLTSETELHRRQRRLAQPAFHRERVAGYAAVMVEKAIRMRERWQPNQMVDMSVDMTTITLEIVTQTLFGTNIEAETAQISQACADAMAVIKAMNVVDLRRMISPALEDQSDVYGQDVQYEEIKNRLDSVIAAIIHQRRQSARDHGDLLSMLLLAQDIEGDETGMTDEQLRDEIVTLCLAGHETTANALTWTWYLLAQHPEIEAQVHAELDRVLGNRVPSARDYPHLSLLNMVFAEAMRLYPPVWMIDRRNLEEYQMGDYTLPPQSVVVMSQWVTHHDPRFFPDPERFDPFRWTPEAKEQRPKFSYFPFGGGPRQCIGEGFAWMEGVLLLATFAQHWKFKLVPGHPIEPIPMMTLRPRFGMPMQLERRTTQG